MQTVGYDDSNTNGTTGQTIGGPKMSGNFVRERQRIVYIYNIHKVGNLISPDEHMTFVKHKIHRSWN